MHHRNEAVYKEIEIFEETEKAQVHAHTENQVELSFLWVFGSTYQFTEIEIHKGGNHNKTQKAPIPPSIKYIAGNEYPPHAESPL